VIIVDYCTAVVFSIVWGVC